MQEPKRRLNQIFPSFLKERSGNVIFIFGLLLPVITVAVGGAVEYSSSVSVRAQAQRALDSGVLVAARAYGSGTTARKAGQAGEDFITNSFEESLVDNFTVSINVDSDGAAEGTLNGTVKSFFTSLVFPNGIEFSVTSAAGFAQTPVDIALVLDVSSSMKIDDGSGTRLSLLKQAVERFLTVIETSRLNAKVAIVPFTATVNVGTGQPFVTGANHPFFDYDPWVGCVFERPGAGMHSAAYDNSETGDEGKWHAYLWPPEPDPHRITAPDLTAICINESDGTGNSYAPGPFETMALPSDPQYADGTSTPTGALKFGPNLNCVRHPITPLTDSVATVRTQVNALTAPSNFGTVIAPGIAWGHRVLTPQAPFTEGGGDRSAARKIMIVLTDGEQTTNGEEFGPGSNCGNFPNHSDGTPFFFDPADFKIAGDVINGEGIRTLMTPYGYILNSDPLGNGDGSYASEYANLDQLARDACTAAKDPSDGVGVEIYTIGLSPDSGPGTLVNSLLNDCATSPDSFRYVDNVDSLVAEFEALAEEFTRLRITN